MPTTKAMQKAVNKYIGKAYDRVQIVVPKGRKEDIEAHSKARGKSVNGLVNDLLMDDMGLTEAQWKGKEGDPGG